MLMTKSHKNQTETKREGNRIICCLHHPKTFSANILVNLFLVFSFINLYSEDVIMLNT
jgi:hypothetical protein